MSTTQDLQWKKLIYEALLELKRRLAMPESIPPSRSNSKYGICGIVCDLCCEQIIDPKVASNSMIAVEKTLSPLFKRWKGFSGSLRFPIGLGHRDENHAVVLFCVSKTFEDYWGDHPYGNARRSLLDHLITQLEEQQ